MLTDITCKAVIKEAKRANKKIKKFDANGLYLHASPNGSAIWKYKYRIFGKEKLISLGAYPMYSLAPALKKHKVTHHRAMEAKDLPDFLYTFDRNEQMLGINTRNLVEMMLHTFTWTDELRRAEKQHFDLDGNRWIIPGEWMKMDQDHIVPLSKQVQLLVKRQMDLHPTSPYLFPSSHGHAVYLSADTINSALDAIGYSGQQTGHGFRALAKSTIKEALGYPEEVVDIQLAHAPKTSNGRAYERAKYLDKRTVMMQEWSDYLDKCRMQGLEKALKQG